MNLSPSSVQPHPRDAVGRGAEGPTEAYARLEGQPHRRTRLQVGLREQPLEVNWM